jgi:hypothetical protein
MRSVLNGSISVSPDLNMVFKLEAGYVCCLKDLVINGAYFDVVAYTQLLIEINLFSYFIYSLGFT